MGNDFALAARRGLLAASAITAASVEHQTAQLVAQAREKLAVLEASCRAAKSNREAAERALAECDDPPEIRSTEHTAGPWREGLTTMSAGGNVRETDLLGPEGTFATIRGFGSRDEHRANVALILRAVNRELAQPTLPGV